MVLSACGTCEPLAFTRGEATLIELCAERAETEAERRAGLAGAAPLAEDRALQLVFPVTGEVCLTNAPVSFAIDAAFVAEDGTIVRLERDVAAGDGTPRCEPAVRSMVETTAGVLSVVAAGDRVAIP